MKAIKTFTQKPKVSVFIASFMTLATMSLAFNTADASALESISAPSENVLTPSKSSALEEINTQACPQQFYQVSLPSNGKLCQVFAADLPASMILFIPQPPAEVLAFFNREPTKYAPAKAMKDRYLLKSADNNTTLIISSDGQGTQVDILVKESTQLSKN